MAKAAEGDLARAGVRAAEERARVAWVMVVAKAAG
jgi:hypothetical protein